MQLFSFVAAMTMSAAAAYCPQPTAVTLYTSINQHACSYSGPSFHRADFGSRYDKHQRGRVALGCANSDTQESSGEEKAAMRIINLPSEPHPDFAPDQVILGLLTALKHNDTPDENTGLKKCFAYSNDMCRVCIVSPFSHSMLTHGSLESYASDKSLVSAGSSRW
mmetsp:Transcript_41287/g.64517  ORF Transcript_41287/g.64517 Transcript_41287/m.64517 type:complete len:165 (-) Transcript_41287:519-1013(-)